MTVDVEYYEYEKFLQPFRDILDLEEGAPAEVTSTNGMTTFHVPIHYSYGLSIEVVIHSSTRTAVCLVWGQHLRSWFGMYLDTQCPSDFVGWLSIVKSAVDSIEPDKMRMFEHLGEADQALSRQR